MGEADGCLFLLPKLLSLAGEVSALLIPSRLAADPLVGGVVVILLVIDWQ